LITVSECPKRLKLNILNFRTSGAKVSIYEI
jgi:hypothetical protein